MSPAPTTNSRASLLSGLRTGGVRSSSATIPHTALPGATFNVPRLVPNSLSGNSADEEQDFVPEMSSYQPASRVPMTAAVDGPSNRFSQQQRRPMNPNVAPFSPAFASNQMVNNAQAQQALQMQMMQLEIMRIQAVQAQQIQSEMLAQAQRQQQSQNRRSSLGFNPPATAGPLSTGFDIRTAALNAQMRRANQAEQPALVADDQVPMTAALGGRFGSRTTSLNVTNSRFDDGGDASLPSTPHSTTVISGGTSLGNPASNNASVSSGQSKSDAATSWRRGGKGNSVLANRAVTSPSVKVTPPPPERVSPPPGITAIARTRPRPLHFGVGAQQPLPTVTIDTSEVNDNDDSSSTSSSKSGSSPTTPHSSSSNEMPLSPREEASKKLYEGLGIGRPASAASNKPSVDEVPLPNLVSHRLVSQPLRQPRGPPSGADELGPKNFATRIRRKAIGGLGMLLDARERREFVEVY
eukprot:GHVO01026255.1.p1 GENE.GHVO01026255.1~~GHVO01026255.1.p1  ORF type:complete len:467 (+),score=30.76 GHVO01026255.1:206-1606(+)